MHSFIPIIVTCPVIFAVFLLIAVISIWRHAICCYLEGFGVFFGVRHSLLLFTPCDSVLINCPVSSRDH